MDPVSLIVGALAAGVAETTTQVVKDAYTGLKVLVQERFAGNAKAELVLAEHAGAPEAWQKPLEQVLVETGATQDAAVVAQAQQVLKLVNPQQAAQGKYNVQIAEGKGIAIGDSAKVVFGRDEGEA